MPIDRFDVRRSGRERARWSTRVRNRAAVAFGAVLLALLFAGPAWSAPHVESDDIGALDRQTATLLERLADGRLAEASVLARQLARDRPDLRLAQLLHAELEGLLAMDDVRPLGQALWSDPLLDLLLEARTRLALARNSDAQDASALPSVLLQLGNDISDVLLVDLSRSELLHFRVHRGVPTLARRHYASSASGGFGKTIEGDMKTPLGVYRVRSYRPGRTLPDLYGAGALTLDYPNALDRSLGRTGSGIWLHGVPSANASRAPWSSEGCVTMSNAYLDALVAQIDRSNTVVVLADSVDWLTPELHAAHVATRLAGLPVEPDSTVIEVPRRGAETHAAIRDTGASGELAPDWRFVALEEVSRDDTDAVAQLSGELIPNVDRPAR